MSTTEVYKLRDWVNGLSIYTHQVCIKQMSKMDYDSLSRRGITIYMGKTSCADISEKSNKRIIKNSFTPNHLTPAQLDFFWISGTNFSFRFNFTSVADSGNLTVYLTDDYDERRECHDNYRPSGSKKIVFPFSDFNSSSVNCTHENGTVICESAQISINETKHYYICMIFSHPRPGARAYYDMYIHEVTYEASHSHHQLCHLNESHCCYTYHNILKEAGNPTCVLITTEVEGSENVAKDMPVPLKIATDKNLEGILYSFLAFCVLLIILLLIVCVFMYTCYRKNHPGHCCQFNL